MTANSAMTLSDIADEVRELAVGVGVLAAPLQRHPMVDRFGHRIGMPEGPIDGFSAQLARPAITLENHATDDLLYDRRASQLRPSCCYGRMLPVWVGRSVRPRIDPIPVSDPASVPLSVFPLVFHRGSIGPSGGLARLRLRSGIGVVSISGGTAKSSSHDRLWSGRAVALARLDQFLRSVVGIPSGHPLSLSRLRPRIVPKRLRLRSVCRVVFHPLVPRAIGSVSGFPVPPHSLFILPEDRSA